MDRLSLYCTAPRQPELRTTPPKERLNVADCLARVDELLGSDGGGSSTRGECCKLLVRGDCQACRTSPSRSGAMARSTVMLAGSPPRRQVSHVCCRACVFAENALLLLLLPALRAVCALSEMMLQFHSLAEPQIGCNP